MSSSSTTSPGGSTATSRVTTYDPFFCTQTSTNLLESSAPALAPKTPLLEPPEVAIFYEPRTQEAAAALKDAAGERERLASERALKKSLTDNDSRYVFQDEKAKFLRNHFKVRVESDEVRAKMGVTYKKWSISGEEGLKSPQHFSEIKFLLKKLYEHLHDMQAELFDPIFAFSDHSVEVHSQALPLVWDLWASFASGDYRTEIDDWQLNNGKDFKMYAIMICRMFIDDGESSLERARREYDSFKFDFSDVARTFVLFRRSFSNLQLIRGWKSSKAQYPELIIDLNNKLQQDASDSFRTAWAGIKAEAKKAGESWLFDYPEYLSKLEKTAQQWTDDKLDLTRGQEIARAALTLEQAAHLVSDPAFPSQTASDTAIHGSAVGSGSPSVTAASLTPAHHKLAAHAAKHGVGLQSSAAASFDLKRQQPKTTLQRSTSQFSAQKPRPRNSNASVTFAPNSTKNSTTLRKSFSKKKWTPFYRTGVPLKPGQRSPKVGSAGARARAQAAKNVQPVCWHCGGFHYRRDCVKFQTLQNSAHYMPTPEDLSRDSMLEGHAREVVHWAGVFDSLAEKYDEDYPVGAMKPQDKQDFCDLLAFLPEVYRTDTGPPISDYFSGAVHYEPMEFDDISSTYLAEGYSISEDSDEEYSGSSEDDYLHPVIARAPETAVSQGGVSFYCNPNLSPLLGGVPDLRQASLELEQMGDCAPAYYSPTVFQASDLSRLVQDDQVRQSRALRVHERAMGNLHNNSPTDPSARKHFSPSSNSPSMQNFLLLAASQRLTKTHKSRASAMSVAAVSDSVQPDLVCSPIVAQAMHSVSGEIQHSQISPVSPVSIKQPRARDLFDVKSKGFRSVACHDPACDDVECATHPNFTDGVETSLLAAPAPTTVQSAPLVSTVQSSVLPGSGIGSLSEEQNLILNPQSLTAADFDSAYEQSRQLGAKGNAGGVNDKPRKPATPREFSQVARSATDDGSAFSASTFAATAVGTAGACEAVGINFFTMLLHMLAVPISYTVLGFVMLACSFFLADCMYALIDLVLDRCHVYYLVRRIGSSMLWRLSAPVMGRAFLLTSRIYRSIVDSGASKVISPHKEKFIADQLDFSRTTLFGMANLGNSFSSSATGPYVYSQECLHCSQVISVTIPGASYAPGAHELLSVRAFVEAGFDSPDFKAHVWHYGDHYFQMEDDGRDYYMPTVVPPEQALVSSASKPGCSQREVSNWQWNLHIYQEYQEIYQWNLELCRDVHPDQATTERPGNSVGISKGFTPKENMFLQQFHGYRCYGNPVYEQSFLLRFVTYCNEQFLLDPAKTSISFLCPVWENSEFFVATYDYEIVKEWPAGTEELFSFPADQTYATYQLKPAGSAGSPGRVFIAGTPFKVALFHRDCNTRPRMTPETEWHWATAHGSHQKGAQLLGMGAPLGRKLSVKRLRTCACAGACAICMQVKLTKPPYQHAEVGKYFDLQPFEIVAVDESGVIYPMAYDGSNYFIVFVCLRTRYRDLFTMAGRDEYSVVLRLYLGRVRKRGFRTRGMYLRQDRAGEHISPAAQEVYDCNDLEPQFTTPPYHEQNPAELVVKETKKQMRAMLATPGLPDSYWSLAAIHSGNVVQNVMPDDSIAGGVPYTVLFDSFFNYTALRVFGLPCYGAVLVEQRDLSVRSGTLHDRARPYVYVGLWEDTSAYKLLDLSTQILHRCGKPTFSTDYSYMLAVCSDWTRAKEWTVQLEPLGSPLPANFDSSHPCSACSILQLAVHYHETDKESYGIVQLRASDGSVQWTYASRFLTTGDLRLHYDAFLSYIKRYTKANKVNEFFPIFEVVKGKPKQSKGWCDGILVSADDNSRLCYGVVFDPAHFEGMEDLPAKSTQFTDDGADPGRTHDGMVTLERVNPNAGKAQSGRTSKTVTHQKLTYATSLNASVYFTRPVPLAQTGYTTATAYKLHPAAEDYTISAYPFVEDYIWCQAEASLAQMVGTQTAMHLSGQHAFACPATVHQARSMPDAADWEIAIDAEIDGLVGKGMIPCSQPAPGVDVIPCSMVLNEPLKLQGDGEWRPAKKCRMVASGNLTTGYEKSETFAPTPETASTFLSFILCQVLKCYKRHFDVSQAFAQGLKLESPVTIRFPKGVVHKESECNYGIVNFPMYGLKISPNKWNGKVVQWMTEDFAFEGLKFRQSTYDSCFYYIMCPPLYCFLEVHVDDFDLTYSHDEFRNVFTSAFMHEFIAKDLGHLTQFLQIQCVRVGDHGHRLHQARQIRNILSTHGITQKSWDVPMCPTLNLSEPSPQDIKLELVRPTLSLLMSVMYAAKRTRPDLLFATCYLSQFANDQRCTQKVYDAAVQVAQFGECTADRGLDFSVSPNLLAKYDGSVDLAMVGYSDSDHARQKLNRRSRTGGYVTLEGMPLLHVCQSQHGVAISSTEAEIVAMSTVSQRMLGACSMLDEIFAYRQQVAFEKLPKVVTCVLDPEVVVSLIRPVSCYVDNDAARLIATAPNLSEKAKHIEIRFLACLGWYRAGKFDYKRVDTEENLADFFTKPIAAVVKGVRKFSWFVHQMMYTNSG